MKKMNIAFINLRNLLILASLFLIIVPISTLSFFINNTTSKEIRENFINSTKSQAVQIDKYFTTYIKHLNQDSKFLSANNYIKNVDSSITTYMSKEKNSSGFIPLTPSKNGELERHIYQVFYSYAQSHPDVQCVYLGTVDGGYIQWPESRLRRNYDPRKREWYKEILNSKETFIITSPYYAIATDDVPVITTGTIIYDNSGGVVGIQAIDVSLDGLSQIVSEIDIGESGYVILTDAQGVILAHPQSPELNFKNLSDIDEYKSITTDIKDNDYQELEINREKYISYTYTSESIGWKLVTIIEKKEIMQSVNKIKTLIAVIAITLALIFFAISIIFSNKLSTPLVSAAQQLRHIEEGNYDYQIPESLLGRSDDLGTFIRSVDSIQKSIVELMSRVRDNSYTELTFNRYLEEVYEQAQSATKQATSVVEVFLKANQEESEDKGVIKQQLEVTSANLYHTQKVGRIGNWEWKIDEGWVYLSPEMIRILGLDSNKQRYDMGEFKELLELNNSLNWKTLINRCLSKENFSIDIKYRTPENNDIWIHSSGKVRFDGDEPSSVIGISQDITEKREALIELKRVNEELRELVSVEVEKSRRKDAVMIYQSRLAKMGEMIDHIAHQWKQPLNNLNLILTNLRDDYIFDDMTDESFNCSFVNSQKIINQMANTIKDFRFYFQPRSKKETFSIYDSVQFSLSLIEESIKLDNIQIELEDNADCRVLGYSNEFSQVLFNILENARDALARSIDIKRKIGISIDECQDMAIVKICNNGGAIRPEIATRIFEPYFTTKESRRGTGIGLYMSKMIIEEHMNGKIIYQSEDNQACFEIHIPISNEVGHNGDDCR